MHYFPNLLPALGCQSRRWQTAPSPDCCAKKGTITSRPFSVKSLEVQLCFQSEAKNGCQKVTAVVKVHGNTVLSVVKWMDTKGFESNSEKQ